MANYVKITLRGYVDLASREAWKAGSPSAYQPAGYTTVTGISVATTFLGDIAAYFHLFRKYRYMGTNCICVPGIRTAADPAFVRGGGYTTPEEMGYDLSAFSAFSRADNTPVTVPLDEETHRGSVFSGDPYFLQDPKWRCVAPTQPFRRFCSPVAYVPHVSFPYFNAGVAEESNVSDDGGLTQELHNLNDVVTTWESASRRVLDVSWKPCMVYHYTGQSPMMNQPTWPLLYWRIHNTIHSKYSYRMWFNHYFQFASPRTHEMVTPTTFFSDMADQFEAEYKKSEQKLPNGATKVGAFGIIRPASEGLA